MRGNPNQNDTTPARELRDGASSSPSLQRLGRMLFEDGGPRWHLGGAEPGRDPAGNAAKVRVMGRNFGPPESLEAGLREAEQRFRLLVDNLEDVFWIVDWKSGRQLYVSPSYRRHWRLDENKLYAGAARWPEAIHPDDRAAVAHVFASLGEVGIGREAFTVEYRLIAGDGEQRWIRDRGMAVRGADGAIDRVVGIAEDMTDRRTVIQALREREQNLQLALDAAQLHVWTLHTPTRQLVIGDALCAIFGLSPSQCRRLGPWRRRVHPEDRARLEASLRRLIALRQPLREEFRVLNADGATTWLDVRAILIPDDDARGACVHGVAGDITERVRVQSERDALLASEHAARQRADASAHSRDEFLAIVSHELRSPLNGIQSWAQVLESTLKEIPPVASRAIAGIRTGVEQQVRLIDDLLDATRVVSGNVSLRLELFTLAPVIMAAVESVRRRADDKRVVLTTDIKLGDETLDGDADRVQQIVWNLLSNAIKFTRAGGHISLSASCEGDCASIHVSDDGRGFDADFAPNLFERFERDETSKSRGQDGLGLGLMLVRHFCELHRGSVSATSPGPGLGATFTVQLPLRREAQAPAAVRASTPDEQAGQSTPTPSLDNLQLLLVDDHVESRDALAVLLEQAGAAVDVLSSGDEAVRWIEQSTAGKRPDVLVCDIAMPGQDGYETLKLIRAIEQKAGFARLPAIALTAFTHNDDRLRAHEAGFDMHIAKPVAIDELIVTIAAFARYASGN